MNLYFRLLRILWKCFRVKKQHPLQAAVLTFRCWPLDCDFNGHMTNARYPALMDLGRTFLTAQAGILYKSYRKGYFAIATGLEINFLREIKPFRTFELHTRLIGWDEKYWYIEQEFRDGERLLANAMVRGLFVHKGRKVAFEEINQLLDEPAYAPTLPEKAIAWRELQQLKKTAGTNER